MQSHRLRIAFMIDATATKCQASACLPNGLPYADVAVLNTHLSDLHAVAVIMWQTDTQRRL